MSLALIAHVAQAAGRNRLSLLEVAAGSGEVPLHAREKLRERGIRLDVTLLDRRISHIHGNGTPRVAADALALPFVDASFDLVGCGLFAHHLSPEALQAFLCDALRICRVAVLVNDLVRHPLHLALVCAGAPLYRSRLTRHDGPASVRQAYTEPEMRALLARTPAKRVEFQRRFLFRMGIVAWKA
jgi:hypothetical protein